MVVFFFHHAGGDKYAFQWLEKQLQSKRKIVSYELPGRNYRLQEQLLNDMGKVIEDTYNTLLFNIENSENFVFVGLSMGALIAFLLTQKLQIEKKKLPKHLFLASRKSIEQYKNNATVAKQPSQEFWKAVKGFGANIDALLQHEELKTFYEPIVRNDFWCLEKFNVDYYAYTLPKIVVPTSIMYGKDDRSIDATGANSWQLYCTEKIEVKAFEGGHFFLYNSIEALLYIERKLNAIRS